MSAEVIAADRPSSAGDPGRDSVRSWRDALKLAPLVAVLVLLILWAAHDGGYDEDTWYWGALILLALVAMVVGGLFGPLRRLGTATKVALGAFALYVVWSYASIAWAAYRGDALSGSNKALLYLLIFALCAVSRWTPRRALWMVTAYTVAVGAVGALILIRMALGHDAAALFTEGRLISPTGYLNANAALFMTTALLGVALAVRRELPLVLRGVLLAIACEGVQLALLAESRGWLFTLPAVLLVALVVVRDRLRIAVAAIIPVIGALVPLHRLLHVYEVTAVAHPTASAFDHAAKTAGATSLVCCLVVLIAGTLVLVAEDRFKPREVRRSVVRAAGLIAAVLALAVAAAGAVAATHGHPIRFFNEQWHGFTHPSTTNAAQASHFASTGSEREDAWRVALDAFAARPIGGLGQDNFSDYYTVHGRTGIELAWVHSWELRLLAHTGIVGFLALIAFLAAAAVAALRRRAPRGSLRGALAGIALLPVIVWLIHGSVDWFWEMPALSAPALAFLAMAGALTEEGGATASTAPARPGRARTAVVAACGVVAFLAAVVVLSFSYLSVREVSIGSDLRGSNPTQALAHLQTAADLNPYDSEPGRLAGTIALQSGSYEEALGRFGQAVARQPGGWFSWFGAGLAASELGDRAVARHNFEVAKSLNSSQQVIKDALSRVDGPTPMTPQQGLDGLVLAH
ncbi:MAG TPA: O-antigen ligase family protein [Solirubrobacteraceae bacterium]|nr:O-antigen ligase family protein [Solirubrobacteraceae bacterium]